MLKFGVKTLVNKNNSSSFMLINLELRFEPRVLGSDVQKTPKREKTI
jgi:hypothetical protein